MSVNPITRTIDRHKQANQAIRATGVEFGKLYESTRTRLNRRLAEAVLTPGRRNEAKYLSELIEIISNEYAHLEQDFRAGFKRAVPYVAESFYFEAMHDLGKSVIGKFDKARAEYLLKDAYTHVAGATRNMCVSDVQFLRNVAGRIFGESAMGGITIADASAQILKELKGRKNFQFVAKDGHVWNSRAYSEMLGRTVLMNSGRKTYFDACLDEGSDVVKVTVSGTCCPDCAVWENRLLSITGSTPGLPTVEDAQAGGLLHPNCTHSFVAVGKVISKRNFENDGRPKNGLNSKEDVQANTAEAWRKYRKT